MPIKSPKQFRLMRAAEGGKIKSKFGPSEAVAKEMLGKTSHKDKSKFAKMKRNG